MNDNAKEVLTTYFSDMENNTTLQNRLNNDAGAMVFLLKISRAVEQEKQNPSLSAKQQKILFSAESMLNMYDNIIKPASDTFTHAINDGNASNEDLMELIENPLYQNSFVYVGNDNIHKGLSSEEITELRHTGSLSSITPVLSQAEKLYNEMSVQAHFNYTKHIDSSFSQKNEAEQNAINKYIDEHPKEIMALSLIAEETHNTGNNVQIYNFSDLVAKCKLAEVTELASKLSYIKRNESIEKHSAEAKPLTDLGKLLGISKYTLENLPNNKCRDI